MVAKLRAYSYDDSWEYSLQAILTETFATDRQSGDHRYFTLLNYTVTQLDAIDAQHGLKYRVLWGIRGDNGQRTEALIFGWNQSGGLARLVIKNIEDNVGGWSNGFPEDTSTIKVETRLHKDYIHPRTYYLDLPTTVDISKDIIEDTLFITKEVESIEKMDLLFSSVTLELDATDNVKNFFDTFWTTDKIPWRNQEIYFAMGLEIDGRFAGYIAPENIIYDEEEDTYTIDAYDWIKFLRDTKWNNLLPSYTVPDLSTFLGDNCIEFHGGGASENVIIDVGDNPEVWDEIEYRAIYRKKDWRPPEEWSYLVLDKNLTVTDFMVETFKNYGAVMYYNEDKKLVFTNKVALSATNHYDEDLIISESMSESFILRNYQGLIINVKSSWAGGTVEGWILIWMENGELRFSENLNDNLSNIEEGIKYIDLRQDFGGKWFQYYIFNDRTQEQRLQDYKVLLEDSRIFEIDVDKLGYNVFDTFWVDDVAYRILLVEEDETQKTSSLRMEKI